MVEGPIVALHHYAMDCSACQSAGAGICLIAEQTVAARHNRQRWRRWRKSGRPDEAAEGLYNSLLRL
jgi:hypothetical protein